MGNRRVTSCGILAASVCLLLAACHSSTPAGFIESAIPKADAAPRTDPLEGLEAAAPGSYVDLPGGRLYLPSSWKPDRSGGWPVTVVLHGYGNLSRSLSVMPFWTPLAEEYQIVLFFADRGTMGWDERRRSLDEILLRRVLGGFRSRKWVRPGGIQLFGWSAGAIMVIGMTAINVEGTDGKPLFDRLAVASGGFGLIMEKELAKDPDLRGAARVPIYATWGEAEASDHGKDAAAYLAERGWPVETETHPGGHILPEETVRGALACNR
jgi:predicted esterase